jgi:SAM-dependent methyltransferase
MQNSTICKYEDFLEPWYLHQEKSLKIKEIFSWHSTSKHNYVNRKFWEWCVIIQALEERNKLTSDCNGLGFAVGTEPLTSYFASKGCKVLATDLDANKSSQGWIDRNEHAASLEQIFYPALIDRTNFDQLVKFQPADMKNLQKPNEKFDFVWSSCALEHLGSLSEGIKFIREANKFLKEGGIAVHTTEYNVSSNTHTMEYGENVIYRAQDLLKLSDELENDGYYLRPLNFNAGEHEYDLNCDVEPYFTTDNHHIKLKMYDYICTSCVLIIEKRPKPFMSGNNNKIEPKNFMETTSSLLKKIQSRILRFG